MKENIYMQPEPLERKVAIAMLSTGNNDKISDALLSIALYDDDWKWSQDQCLRFLDHPNDNVRRIAAMGLGHIARIHGNIDKEKVVSALKNLMKEDENEEVVGTAEDALSDIKMFIKNN